MIIFSWMGLLLDYVYLIIITSSHVLNLNIELIFGNFLLNILDIGALTLITEVA